MTTTRIMLALVLGTVTTACGNTSSAPPERATAAVSGVVFQGPVAGATVRAYSYADGRKGAELAQALTDASGRYAFSGSLPSGVVLLEVTGGTYREEASARDITVGTDVPLRSLIRVGSNTGGTIGTYTTFGAALADYLASRGRSLESAIDEAYTAINAAVGVDVRSTAPLDVTDVANAGGLTPAHEYGFFEAALSQWTADAGIQNNVTPHTLYTSSSMLTLAFDDLRSDGVLDGRGSNGAQRLGSVALSTDTYRHELALALLRFARSGANRTGLTSDQLLRAANRWNDSRAALFGDAAVRPISSAAPTVTNLAPVANTYVRGRFSASARVDDVVGLTTVSFGIDGSAVANAADVQQPRVDIDSSTYSDGARTLYVEARNMVGGVTRAEHRINIDNTAPTITNFQPAEGSVVRNSFTLSASVSDTRLSESTFSIDGTTLGNQGSAGSPRYTLDTRSYSSGNHTLTLRSTDAAGNVRSVSRQLYFLNSFGF